MMCVWKLARYNINSQTFKRKSMWESRKHFHTVVYKWTVQDCFHLHTVFITNRVRLLNIFVHIFFIVDTVYDCCLVFYGKKMLEDFIYYYIIWIVKIYFARLFWLYMVLFLWIDTSAKKYYLIKETVKND